MTTLLSGYYIAIVGLVLTAFSFHVSVQRGRKNIWYDDGGDLTLARARRAHYTMLEFSVIFLLALVTYELMGGAKGWIHPLGLAFLLGRLLHVIGALFLKPASPPRALGALISHVATVIVSIRVLMLLM
jgi:hypothetical protein